MTCMVFINSKVKLFNVDSNDGKSYKVENNGQMFGDKKVEENVQDMQDSNNRTEVEENVQDIQDSNNRTPTPKLLAHTYSVPYNENLEVEIAERERLRSLSRASSGFASDNSELSRIFKRRKKRGHNWTRRKGATSTPRCSRSSTPRCSRSSSRKRASSVSSYSNSSYSSSRRKYDSKKSTPSILSSTRTSSRFTRSVSRANEEENLIMSNFLYCNFEQCNEECEDADRMNQHNIEEHHMIPYHYCYECHQVFTSATLLMWHQEGHYSAPVHCLMCGIIQSNTQELQTHLDEHMVYSVPCKYCDKSFLSKSIREKHTQSHHKKKRERLTFREQLILDRINKHY